MGTYLARRVILLIPTLVGITLLVFLLVAMSPGGVGAAAGDAAGETGQGGQALTRAYFEDRYGLDDPVIVQYGRWLARLSPVKFGAREQVAPDGEMVRRPRAVRPPVMWPWFVARLPEPSPEPAGREAPRAQETTARVFKQVAGELADRRAEYVAAETRLRGALAVYVAASGIEGAVTSDGRIKAGVLARHQPDRTRAEWGDVERAGASAVRAYAAAAEARVRMIALLDARPFPSAGLPLIPGVVSLGMPDLGTSVHSQPVAALIGRALPVTMLLNLLALPIIYAVAIPCGIRAAARPRGWFDVASGAVLIALWSVPVVWAGTLAIGFLADRRYLGWFPVAGLHSAGAEELAFLSGRDGAGGFAPGWLLDTLWHVALPVACLAYAGFAVLARQTRAAMLDNLRADYVRTARAKGVPERDVLLRHVFRNSLLPLITMVVQVFPAMLAGSVVVERIFSIPGMGSLLLTAIMERDREVILANTVMIAGVNLLALLLADVLYAMADPRVAYE